MAAFGPLLPDSSARPVALLCAILSGAAPARCVLASAAALGRAMLVWHTDHALGKQCRAVALLAVWDIVQFLIFVASFFSSRVDWRGITFRVDRNGLLRH
jgi:ceramide glucosyltransferase